MLQKAKYHWEAIKGEKKNVFNRANVCCKRAYMITLCVCVCVYIYKNTYIHALANVCVSMRNGKLIYVNIHV